MISTEQTQKRFPGLKYHTKQMSRKRIKNIHPLIENKNVAMVKFLNPRRNLRWRVKKQKLSTS